MKIKLDQPLIDQFPHVKIGILTIRGADNKTPQPELLKLLREEENQVRERLSTETLTDDQKIADWREAYRTFGFKPSKYRPSVEALLRRVLQGKELPDLSPLVNIYTLISIKHTLPAGSDDLDHISGPIRLTMAEGTETFHMLGAEEAITVEKGEVIYRDDDEVLTRAWNYRECEKSKITPESTNVNLVIEGLEHTTRAEMKQALQEMKALVQQFTGGTIEEHILLGTHLPEYHFFDDFKTRSAKLKEIRDLDIDPYPPLFEPTFRARDLESKYSQETIGNSEEAEAGSTPKVRMAGRLVLFRPMGKNIFAHIQDEGHRFQIMFNKDQTKVIGLKEGSSLNFIQKKLDIGDIIGVEGHLFKTQTGEITLYAKEVTLLCKTLLPLPNKWKGLTDKGVRYRKRWLDLISNPDVADTFRMRSRIMNVLRNEMAIFDFIEVETPILQNIYGGAEARPFVSHLNALSQDMYLRIALEISLKKLVVGGMDRVFEIGKVFRNEGIDRTHNPEFSMFEAYAAYWDYNQVMDFTEHLFEKVALELFGSTNIGTRKDKAGGEHTIDLKRPWKRLTMKESIKEYANIDVDTLSDDEMVKILKKETDLDPAAIESAPRGKRIAMFFEELVEHHLIQPHHITDHPIETTPLCKLHRDPKERAERIVERFESFILGFEFCNAYTELNDPEIQRALLEDQAKKREAGDDEANPLDEEFIEAICQGMPPTGGVGIGMDRMTMLFSGAESIRDVLYFPVMRPED